MKKHLTTILLILVLLVGLSIMLYPTISDYINKKNASRVIADYDKVIVSATEEDISSWIDGARVYNRALAANPAAFYKPELIDGYDEALNITGSGVMGYIDIEKVKIHLPIYHGVEDVTLQVGAGHLPGTSLPIGGKSTHCVLSGHRGLPSSRLFTDLDDLVVGDVFTVTAANQVMTYQIDQIKVVLPEETDDLQIVEGMDYCTLLTCTPYGVNSHRLLVRGVRVGNIESDEEEEYHTVYVANEAFIIDAVIVAPIVAVPMLVIVFAVLAIIDKIRKSVEKISPRKEGR